MKKAFTTLFFITNSIVMMPMAHGLTTVESFCTNPTATVIYQVSDVATRLFVTKAPSTIGGNILNAPKIELTDFAIDLISEQELESSFTSTCDQVDNAVKGIKTLKNLSFRKVRIAHVDGERLPEGILGLSADGKSLDVDYLCDERIHEEVACE